MRRLQMGLYVLAISAILLFVNGSAGAASLDHFNLDSLVLMSQEIVEGKIGESYNVAGFPVAEIKVESVYKGKLRKGDSARTFGLYIYTKPKPNDPQQRMIPLDKGDHVFLFLTRDNSHLPESIRKEKECYRVIGSGAKLVLDGKISGFHQGSNPGPYVLDSNAPMAGKLWNKRVSRAAESGRHEPPKQQAVEEFRQQLPGTIAKMNDFAAKLDAAKTSNDGKWFLQTIQERMTLTRSTTLSWDRDRPAELAAAGLANLHVPIYLELALEYDSWGIIARGFGTPAGRDYLLVGIQDTKRSQESRLRLARAVEHADYVYRSRLENIETRGWRIVGKAGVRNDDYITRIAKLVLENTENEELCSALIRSIDFFGRTIVQTDDPDTHADLQQAQAVLKQRSAKPTNQKPSNSK